ncbi:MAG: Glu-tRNA(Gln) amidotransferase subunit GatD [Candidatus Aenigmatarchaeota archaeon]
MPSPSSPDGYSEAVQKALKTAKIGDKIGFSKNGKAFVGFLMPKSAGNPDAIVVKLENGYNVGVHYEKGAEIQLLEKRAVEVGTHKASALHFDESKPAVSLVTTGGTITSKVDYATGGVVSLMDPAELLVTAPELADFVNVVSIVSPFRKMSENMTPSDWIELAKTVAKELNKDEIKGVIVTHGTDILHYTSAALSFFLKNLNKPVVLVGSQRSTDRPSSDASMNLICAARIAISDAAEVGICMHSSSSDDYCIFSRGSKVRKMHASRRDAFRPINDLPIAKVFPDGKTEFLGNYRRRSDEKVVLDDVFEENIALIKFYPGSNPNIIDHYIKNSCKGFVIEATGLGHVNVSGKNSWLSAISSATKKGIPVFFVPQTLYGRLNMNVYSSGRILIQAGVVPLEDMLPETAYVKLGWVLGHKDVAKDIEKVKQMMLTNIAGEISPRSLPDTFLY